MQLIKWKTPINFNLFLFGDDQEGNILRHNKGWMQLVDMMHSEHDGCGTNWGVDHGDFCDAITCDDPRYDEITVQSKPMEQLYNGIKHRDAIKDKIICILEGNHPLKLWRFGALTQKLCEHLGVQYGTWSSKISFVDSRHNLIFKHYCTHGKKGINSTADDPRRRKANMELVLKRHLKFKSGDSVLMSKGHTHKLLCCRPESDLYLSDDGREVRQSFTKVDHDAEYIHPDLRWYVNTGSFLRTLGVGISSYSEIAEYDPIELGFYICRVRDRKIEGIDKIRVD